MTLSCPEPRCGEMFSNRGGRRDHYRSIHTTKKKKHECIFCNAQYSYQHDYSRHLVMAQHPFADQTDIDKAVHAQAVISAIADIHRPRRYVCKEPRCGMSFPDSSNCRDHYDGAHTVLKKVCESNKRYLTMFLIYRDRKISNIYSRDVILFYCQFCHQ